MGRIFGTDGARGVANSELTCELAMNIGRAAATILTKNNQQKEKPKIIIGKDPRLSSDMLQGALIAGICSVGVDVLLLGVVPTPAVAYLVKKYKAQAGIMISASHNSFEFNGIKIFNSDGYKLPDELEENIEELILEKNHLLLNTQKHNIGKVYFKEQALRNYIEHIKKTTSVNLDGMRIAFDCSNGSASGTAKTLFTELGAECFMLFDTPDGININQNCGSIHMENLRKFVLENKLDAGIAFDGDADRCLAVDNEGNIIDGDLIMAICAEDLNATGKLAKGTVVGTIMSNMGLLKRCEKLNLNFISTQVGDRYVLETMLREGYNFGGEQSGHIIFLDYSTSGDGQLTAVQLLSILKRRGGKFSEIYKLVEKYPQVIVNVKITQEGKLKFYTDEIIKNAIENIKYRFESFGKNIADNDANFNDDIGVGRILVRISGTEPLVRVMLEGENKEKIESIAMNIAKIIEERC